MNPKDICSAVQVREGELYLPINTARSHESRVEGGRPVRSKHHLDVSSRVEAIKLGNQFEHCSLHFIVATSAIIESCASNSINLIKEYDASLFRPCHLEKLPHHSSTLAHVFLHKLTTNYSYKCCVRSICNCSCAEGLACSWWTIEKSAFRRVDSK